QVQLSEQGLVSGARRSVFSEVADYEVEIKTDAGLTILASGSQVGVKPQLSAPEGRKVYTFRGENLRGFTVILAERVKSVETRVGDVRVVSYFREGDEKLGKKALRIAASALEVYTKSFGDYPYPLLEIIELPLLAGYSSVDFPSIIALAQAYYIDFDAPHSARL